MAIHNEVAVQNEVAVAAEEKVAVPLLKKMLLIRSFEEKTYELYLSGILPGFIHLYIGEEAVAAGVCQALREDDYISSTHRGHGHLLAKGGSPRKMVAELFGKQTGYCKGKGGSMHIFDFGLNILGANGIVGGGIPIATGAALSAKMRGTDQVVACFFGDGGTNQGCFHESLNLAAIWDLPVLYVCENNQYAMSTPQKKHQKMWDIYKRGSAYGIPGVLSDGNDALDVYEKASAAVARAREGKGPTLIECRTYRKMGHHVGDPGTNRPKEEIEAWGKRDPIAHLKGHLVEQAGCSEAEFAELEQEVQSILEDAVQYAQESPDPLPEETLDDVYKGEMERTCL